MAPGEILAEGTEPSLHFPPITFSGNGLNDMKIPLPLIREFPQFAASCLGAFCCLSETFCLLSVFNAGPEGAAAVSHHRAHGSEPSGEGHDPRAVSHALRGLPAPLPALAAARQAQSRPHQTDAGGNPLSGPHCGAAHPGSAQWRLCRSAMLRSSVRYAARADAFQTADICL